MVGLARDVLADELQINLLAESGEGGGEEEGGKKTSRLEGTAGTISVRHLPFTGNGGGTNIPSQCFEGTSQPRATTRPEDSRDGGWSGHSNFESERPSSPGSGGNRTEGQGHVGRNNTSCQEYGD